MSGDTPQGRCGNCMAHHRNHHKRMSAPPACPNGSGSFRKATDAELEAGYKAAFPDGPKPLATVKLEDLHKVADVLSAHAMVGYFGPGGAGVDQLAADLAARLSPPPPAGGMGAADGRE